MHSKQWALGLLVIGLGVGGLIVYKLVPGSSSPPIASRAAGKLTALPTQTTGTSVATPPPQPEPDPAAIPIPVPPGSTTSIATTRPAPTTVQLPGSPTRLAPTLTTQPLPSQPPPNEPAPQSEPQPVAPTVSLASPPPRSNVPVITLTPPPQPSQAMPPPERVPQPVPRPLPPTYSGPTSGVVNWSGQLEKNGTVVIEGDRCSSGSLSGRLPGQPVLIDLDTKEFALAEVPSPSNGWNRLVIRSKNGRHSVVTIRWTLLQ